MLQVLLSWIIIAIVFLAFGSMLSSFWNMCSKRDNQFSLFDTFWLGVAAVTALTTIVSLFLPISIGVLFVFLGATALYIFIYRNSIAYKLQEVLHSIRQLSWRAKMTWAFPFCVFLFYLLVYHCFTTRVCITCRL